MIQIRRYTNKDLQAVLSAWENTQKIAHPFLTEDFQAQEKINIQELYLPNADTWVLEDKNDVVGFIALIGNEVGGLFLQPAYHGQKLGKMMMDKAQELHGDLIVDVFEKNLIGGDFYSKYGFRLIEKKIHDQTGESVLRLGFTPG